MIIVRPIKKEDIVHIANYWVSSSEAHLLKMGVDLAKRPQKNDITRFLETQLKIPLNSKISYALIWILDGHPIGHCNVNQIEYGEQAFMHLHLWDTNNRKKGLGAQLVKLSLPYFFNDLKLKQLFCEPYALNPAPNKTLEKIGFKFIKEHITIPGSINFEQLVKRWRITKLEFKAL